MVTIDILTIMFVLAVFNILASVFFVLYVQLTHAKIFLNYFISSKALQGFSWLIRLLFYSQQQSLFFAFADLLLITGFMMESVLFVRFKQSISARLRVFYFISILLIFGSIMLVGRSMPNIKDLFILIGYLLYMSIISVKLLFSEDSTRFQKLVGICYGILPLMSTVLFIAITEEVTTVGKTTSIIGIMYYVTILLTQVIGGVGYLLMVNERDENTLREIAIKDPLTGILNRRAFYDYAELLFHKAIRDHTPITMVMIDVDHFKLINDAFGHLHGDTVLKFLCQHLSSEMRKVDLLARYGGEEFMIMLSGVGAEEAEHFVSRIHKSTREAIESHRSEITPFTISIGAYSAIPSTINELDIMLNRSDEALYQSKESGRDRATLASIIDQNITFKPLIT